MKRFLLATSLFALCLSSAAAQTADPRLNKKLVLDEEFNGTAVDYTKWAGVSSSHADNQRGNLGNTQLEYSLNRNASVANGILTITAKRESFTSPSGKRYNWTSAMLTSSGSTGLQCKYCYIEERAKFPKERGFWPSFWTWQPPGANSTQETDVYEWH